MSDHIDRWVDSYCPKCFLNNGVQYQYYKYIVESCSECGWSGKDHELLTHEQMINNQRSDKLKDILTDV